MYNQKCRWQEAARGDGDVPTPTEDPAELESLRDSSPVCAFALPCALFTPFPVCAFVLPCALFTPFEVFFKLPMDPLPGCPVWPWSRHVKSGSRVRLCRMIDWIAWYCIKNIRYRADMMSITFLLVSSSPSTKPTGNGGRTAI